ncbi:MAG: hypothetical protein ACE5G2_07540, partial [Candidatus Krumholzibacteriia bacterium]
PRTRSRQAMLGSSHNERRASISLHPQTLRRYEHIDLTSFHMLNRRTRRKSMLLHEGVYVAVQRYRRHPDATLRGLDELRRTVTHELRRVIRADWTEEHVARRALEIAERFLGERGEQV